MAAASASKALADFPTNQKKDLPIALKTEDVKGKTYIVTGATGGIGYEAVKHLVRLEAAKVIIGVRNAESGKAAKTTIETETGRKDIIEVWPLDLASYDSVKAFAKKIESVDRIDALVLNAGASIPSWQIKEGSEGHVTVNFISNFLLVFAALPQLQAAAKKHDIKPRLVIVGSMGGFFVEESTKKFPKTGILDDLNDKAKWQSDFANRYVLTKLLEHQAMRELVPLVPVSEHGVIVNIVDPGLCKTGLTKELSIATRLKAWLAKALLGRTPEMGSRTLIHGIAAGEESHGKYLTSCEIQEDHIPDWMNNEAGIAIQKQVWKELIEKLEKIQPGVTAAVVQN
ncbi:short-chain dehydrogenase [Trichoderma arundinaceum]|uniref:Short-chain dehydrogenase n=1 Tax=Trichoderma arundinaceum TaxID=490622 RepID=A0A395NN59_TRIAR|nr:short-chain dehydrogenase [Trichoderma arundinaceum]